MKGHCELRAGLLALGVILRAAAVTAWSAPPSPERVHIFPAESKHNHASCIVETRDGSLLAAWYSGSGERKADDVVIEGAWLRKGKSVVGAEVPAGRHAGLSRLQPGALRRAGRIALAFLADDPRPPLGRRSAEVRAQRPAFARRGCSEMVVLGRPAHHAQGLRRRGAIARSPHSATRIGQSIGEILDEAKHGRADELYQRLGWMPRVHPLVLPSGRWILPLYSDTFYGLDHGDLRRSGRDLDGEPALDRLRQHSAQPGAQERRVAGRVHARQWSAPSTSG